MMFDQGMRNGMIRETLKRHWKMLLVVLGILVIGVGGWFVTRPKEPVYQGKTASQWFREIDQPAQSLPNGVPVFDDAPSWAFRTMGKDSVPFLVGQLQISSSRLHNKTVYWANRLLPRSKHLLPDDVRQSRAMRCLFELGAEAEPAIPKLIEIADDVRNNDHARGFAIAILGNIQKQPGKLIPVLVNALNTTNIVLLDTTIEALEKFGQDAKPALPFFDVHFTSIKRAALATVA